MERKCNADRVKTCARLMGKAPVGRPMKTWQNTVSADTHLLNIDLQDVIDRDEANPAAYGTTKYFHERLM